MVRQMRHRRTRADCVSFGKREAEIEQRLSRIDDIARYMDRLNEANALHRQDPSQGIFSMFMMKKILWWKATLCRQLNS